MHRARRRGDARDRRRSPDHLRSWQRRNDVRPANTPGPHRAYAQRRAAALRRTQSQGRCRRRAPGRGADATHDDGTSPSPRNDRQAAHRFRLIRSALPFVLTFALLLAFATTAAPAAAASPAAKASGAQEELRQLKSRIEAIKKRLTDAEGLKSEAADALEASE